MCVCVYNVCIDTCVNVVNISHTRVCNKYHGNIIYIYIYVCIYIYINYICLCKFSYMWLCKIFTSACLHANACVH